MSRFTPDHRYTTEHRFAFHTESTVPSIQHKCDKLCVKTMIQSWFPAGNSLDKSCNVISLFLYNKSITCITKYVRNITTTSCTISSKNFVKNKVRVYRKMAEQIWCSHSLPAIRDTVWHGSEQLWRLFSLVFWWLALAELILDVNTLDKSVSSDCNTSI